jgi:hypothetical protein
MSGYIEFAPVEFTGPNIATMPKIARIDPIESAGSLLLIEAAHPLGAWPAGVAHNTALPNLFKATADTVIGGGTKDAFFDNVFAGKGLVERTPKGGIHGVVSPTLATSANDRFDIVAPSVLKTFMKANKTHSFYISVWARRTKIADPGAALAGIITTAISSNGTWAIQGNPVSLAFSGGTALGSTQPANTVGPSFSAAAGIVAQDFDTQSDTAGNKNNALAVLGNRQGGAALGLGGGRIIYRIYFEDLTVSGRNFDTVKAIDLALYTKHVLTAGGRYYGDTFTDPATVV